MVSSFQSVNLGASVAEACILRQNRAATVKVMAPPCEIKVNDSADNKRDAASVTCYGAPIAPLTVDSIRPAFDVSVNQTISHAADAGASGQVISEIRDELVAYSNKHNLIGPSIGYLGLHAVKKLVQGGNPTIAFHNLPYAFKLDNQLLSVFPKTLSPGYYIQATELLSEKYGWNNAYALSPLHQDITVVSNTPFGKKTETLTPSSPNYRTTLTNIQTILGVLYNGTNQSNGHPEAGEAYHFVTSLLN